jgi:hypothetical protein
MFIIRKVTDTYVEKKRGKVYSVFVELHNAFEKTGRGDVEDGGITHIHRWYEGNVQIGKDKGKGKESTSKKSLGQGCPPMSDVHWSGYQTHRHTPVRGKIQTYGLLLLVQQKVCPVPHENSNKAYERML